MLFKASTLSRSKPAGVVPLLASSEHSTGCSDVLPGQLLVGAVVQVHKSDKSADEHPMITSYHILKKKEGMEALNVIAGSVKVLAGPTTAPSLWRLRRQGRQA